MLERANGKLKDNIKKGKGKTLSKCLIKNDGMAMYGELQVYLHHS
jgi:hypothetical protein